MVAGQGRWRRRLALVLVVVVAAAGGWWSGRTALTPAASAVDEVPGVVTATVQPVSVGRTLSYMATVTQPFASVAANGMAGVVTQVGPGGLVASGDVLFAVAGQSVFAVSGEVPFYRDLGPGVSGADVEQLQQALVEWGYRTPVDGRFGSATRAAVRAWQRDTGQDRAGVVAWGTVLAIPDLPTVVRLGDAIVRGDVLAGGETAVLARAGDPRFALHLSTDQAALVPAGAAVDVRAGDVVWPAVAGDSVIDENGMTVIALTAPDGSLVCAQECDLLGGTERSTLMSTVWVVPATQGPGVPVAAVRTAVDGSTHVVLADGERVPVTVLASGDGLAVVDGIEVGVQVRVLDGPATSAPGDGTPAGGAPAQGDDADSGGDGDDG